MIRISLISKHYKQIEPLIQQFFNDLQIEYKLTNYTHQTIQDIYFVEIEKKNDLNILNHLKKLDSTLIYIIGPKDFDLVSICLQMQTHLYFINNELEKQFIHYHDFIQKQIQKNFQYYLYQRNGITSKIRLSQIYYIESLRHQIIIHSINGEMIERKTLSQFIKEKMLKDECHTLVGYHLNQIISTATIYYYDILPSNENSKGKVGQITNVWVDENYRHLGIGRYMVEYLIENYQKDVGMICLNSSKEGINMYLHLGFKKKDNYLIYKNG